MMKTKFNIQQQEDLYMDAILAFLSEILETLKKTPAQDCQYYDSADIKRMFNISDSTLYRLRRSGNIPYVRIGHKIYYPKSFFNNAFKK